MGFAVAAEAARRGAEVVLVGGPCGARDAARCAPRRRGERARDARRGARASSRARDVVVKAAAVADFRPASRVGAQDQARRISPRAPGSRSSSCATPTSSPSSCRERGRARRRGLRRRERRRDRGRAPQARAQGLRPARRQRRLAQRRRLRVRPQRGRASSGPAATSRSCRCSPRARSRRASARPRSRSCAGSAGDAALATRPSPPALRRVCWRHAAALAVAAPRCGAASRRRHVNVRRGIDGSINPASSDYLQQRDRAERAPTARGRC